MCHCSKRPLVSFFPNSKSPREQGAPVQKSPAQEAVREVQGAAARGSKKQRQNGVSRRGQSLILHLFSVAAMQAPAAAEPAAAPAAAAADAAPALAVDAAPAPAAAAPAALCAVPGVGTGTGGGTGTCSAPVALK